jgi:peroxiredoxin
VRAFKSEFDRRGVSVVVVSFAEPATIGHYLEHHQWPFPVLADPQRRVYRAFDLKSLPWYRVLSPGTLRLYLKLFRKGLIRRHYGKEDIYQSGGDFVIDRDGNLLFAHRSQDPADRPSMSTLLKAIDRSLRVP